jgi:hypothetical protein
LGTLSCIASFTAAAEAKRSNAAALVICRDGMVGTTTTANDLQYVFRVNKSAREQVSA